MTVIDDLIQRNELFADSEFDARLKIIPTLKANPQLPGQFLVTGMVYDVVTRKVEVVVPPAPLRPQVAA